MLRWNFDSRTRNPLMRLLFGVAGAIALVALLAFGLFAAAALIIGGAIVMLVKGLRAPRDAAASRPTPATSASAGVIEGEFTVVQDVQTRRQPVR